MRKRLNTLLACGLLAGALATAATPDEAARRQIEGLPSYFEPNLGGAHHSAQFAGRNLKRLFRNPRELLALARARLGSRKRSGGRRPGTGS